MFSFVYKNIDFAHKLDMPSSPSEDYYKHIHPFLEVIFFVRGNVLYTVESEVRKLCEGDIVVVSSQKYHFATVDSSVPYERYVLKFPETSLPERVRDKLAAGSAFYCNSKKFGNVFSRLDTYKELYENEELYALFLCEAVKFTVMLCHDDSPTSGKNNEFIKSIIDYVDANIQKPITMQTLADEFMYSKSFISIEFKRHMKIPIMQYVRSKKILAARQMILSGAKKSEAAEAFGFETYSTFYRAYTKMITSYDHADSNEA